MWLIDGNEFKKRLLAERDKIPYTVPGADYEFRIPQTNHFGNAMRGGIRKALRCLEECAHVTDVVEVVRCKNCKYWHEETGWCHHNSHFLDANGEACYPWESNDWKMFSGDDYCSLGELK